MSNIGTAPDSLERFRRSPLIQVTVIAILVLCLQIPVFFVQSLVWERDRTRQEAIREVTDKWGRAQEIVGPFLVIPYGYLREETDNKGEIRLRELESEATFLPDRLTVNGDLKSETRYRGIFEVPVYQSALDVSGEFSAPDFSDWGVDPEKIYWDRARIVFEISDVRAVQTARALDWPEGPIEFAPGAGGNLQSQRSGIHAPLAERLDGESFPFSTRFEMNGSLHMRFAPLGRDTEVTLNADWPDPSFQGAWLPADRNVDAAGFSATWRIPHLGRNYPQRWTGGEAAESVAASQFGVDLISPVDPYRQTERSLKYQLLFIGLTFITIWLYEVLGGLRLHMIQYALIGAALCLFYLLELSLAEHIGFGAAYAAAALSIVGMVTAYGLAILASKARALLLGGVMAGLYSCLFVLIQLQDYALLVGSVGLFLILSGIMYATRNVNWFAPRAGGGGQSLSE